MKLKTDDKEKKVIIFGEEGKGMSWSSLNMTKFMMIVPRCKKCKATGKYFSPVEMHKDGTETWFHICMCPKCHDILESNWRGTTNRNYFDMKLMENEHKK